MTIIGIDPGPEESAAAIYDPSAGTVAAWEEDNVALNLRFFITTPADTLVIEWLTNYGKPVGNTVFDTCEWVGRFRQAFKNKSVKVTRPTICRHFCGTTHYVHPTTGKRKPVTKANVKAALYQRFGGDRSKAVGTKKKPGPLYGMKGDHVFDALAVAVWYAETREDGR